MKTSKAAALEAVLFASGEPVPVARLARALDVGEQEVRRLAQQLDERLADAGICLLRLEDSLQLAARPEYAGTVRMALDMRRDTPLTNAAMEVLAVVAYRQPVTKNYVDQVRGVDCGGVLASLSEKGLIAETGRLDVPGRPILYGTTDAFLRTFGLSSLEELPPVQEQESGGQLQWSLQEES